MEVSSMSTIPQDRREFTVQNAYLYDHRSTSHWLFSHIWRHKQYLFLWLFGMIVAWVSYAQVPVIFGQTINQLQQPDALSLVIRAAIIILVLRLLDGFASLGASLSLETIAQRLEAFTREELYGSLLGKSQAFHDRQQVGDIMARATDDVRQLNGMVNPGFLFIYESILGFTVPILFMVAQHRELLTIPLIFAVTYVFLVRSYIRRLGPVVQRQRAQFGKMNAGLEETISGIEVVKASSQENFERKKFNQNARLFRDFFVRQGQLEARYLPSLVYAIVFGLIFLHSIWLVQRGELAIGGIVTVMGLATMLRFPTDVSSFSFSLIQQGLASAERIRYIITEETELDQNQQGFNASIQGDIRFDRVSFQYGTQTVLENISFHIRPGQTIAIVGQTGSGKSTLTQLINRTYDATYGRILIDGVDVREWNLDALRSQISKIEQDVFLFSRSIAENIAFGMPQATQEQIEQAAKEAQAHDFITSFAEGYKTVLGERGVTLSGGQRQRIALARAFLSNPRILILDDSTSAIDSATEDEIQKAIHRAQEGRTTILITHRLSQIRWADYIILLDKGCIVGGGTHDELLRRSTHYRRIFARYDVDLPPLETEAVASSISANPN